MVTPEQKQPHVYPEGMTRDTYLIRCRQNAIDCLGRPIDHKLASVHLTNAQFWIERALEETDNGW